jgi:hypothetical protein
MININIRIHILTIVFQALLLLFTSQFSFAQQTTLPFKSGEKLHYKVSYNWEFIWVDAGKVVFEADSLQYNNQPAYHFRSYGRSMATYDWLFKVRDHFQSVAGAGNFNPHWYERNTREGDYRVKNRFEFDYTNKQIIAKTETSQKPVSVDTLALDKFVLDLQTAVYYARSLNFNEMKVNDKIPLCVIIDGKIYELFGRYLGKETIENHDRQIYRCHKFSAMLVEGTIFKGGEDLFVWVTDDKNHIPILVEAKILVGSVKAYFTGGENILYPMESLVE